MSTKKNKPRDSSGKTRKDGNSHHDVRPQSGTTARQPSSTKEKKNENEAAPIVSTNAKSDARPKTGYSRRNPSITQPLRPRSADTRLVRGTLKGEKLVDVSIKVLECDTKNGSLENEKAEWEKEKVELQRRLKEEKEKVKEAENKMREINEKNEKELNQSQTKWDEYCKKQTKKHSKEKEELLNIIKNLTVEKEHLLTRLSTIAADRLVHGNVNIADLSDADRPTKLSEVYSELYDNEWTNAFEELTCDQKISDKDAIMILLKILMSSFWNCREITWGRYERLLKVASSIDIEQGNSLSSAKKVMSNVSKPSLTIQEAESSIAQLDNNDKTEDQNGAKENVEMADQGTNAASKDEFAKEKEKKLAMDKNVDTIQQGTASSEGGKTKGMQIDEKENVEYDGKENVESGDPKVSGASKDKSENVKGKTGGKENVESGDPNVSGASKDKSENVKGKIDGKENGESDGKENEESAYPNMSGALKDKSKNNGAKENMESGDTNVSGASKDKLERENGKHLKHTIELDVDLMLGLKGIWRKTTLELKGILAEPIYSVIETCLEIPVSVLPMTSKYLKRCIDLCWKMGVQEKPLHLGSITEMDASVGKKFDKDKFRAYTQSGRNVAFVVWPTLYLYEGGPVLIKGIAQGCSSDEYRNTEMHS